MLEQYSDHPPARQKIVLISPGYVALEIQRLGFNEVKWPLVFAHRSPPPDITAKYDREKAKVKQQRARVLRSKSLPVATNDTLPVPRLLDMVPSWNVNAAMSRASSGVGFRVSQDRANTKLDHLDLAEIVEGEEEVD